MPFIEIKLVITQPDRPVGRTQALQSSPVKQMAKKHKINIAQPVSLKGFVPTGHLPKGDTLAIVAQYGLLIPKQILDAPKFGILNVHPSLLPKYRGASPIQSALINGEKSTGVTIIQLDEGLDTGPILAQKKVDISAADTSLELGKKLALLSLEILRESIPTYLAGTLTPMPQDNAKATLCRELTRADGRVNWQNSCGTIYNLYRGLEPWPGIWTTYRGQRLKLLRIKPIDESLAVGVVMVSNTRLFIGCGYGAIEVLEMQMEGKKPMPADEFIRGHQAIDGTKLGAI